MRKSWSILIFVLFMMIVTSLLALLITQYIRNILNYSSNYYKFEKSYYLAYWWIELELIKIKNHWPGFEDSINSTSPTNLKNRNCKNCYFETQNKSLSNVIWWDWYTLENEINDCSQLPEEHWIKLKWWEGIIFPLFIDNDSNINSENNIVWNSNYSIIDIKNQQINIFINWNIWDHFIIWFTNWNKNLILSWKLISNSDNKNYSVDLNFNVDNNTYMGLIRKTSWYNPDNFCLQLPEKITTNRNYIISKWKYLDFYLTLKTVKLNKVPDYLIYSIIK